MRSASTIAPTPWCARWTATADTPTAGGSAHLVIIGGAPLDGPRRMNWNFVSSDPQRIDAARARWAAGDWPHVPGETTRIELPR